MGGYWIQVHVRPFPLENSGVPANLWLLLKQIPD